MQRNHDQHGRPRGALAVATLVLAVALMSSVASSAASDTTAAHAARSLIDTATAHLHLIKPEGSQLIEQGPVTGALAGSMRAALDTGAVFTGSFTIYIHGGGSISGRGRAIPHGSGRYQSFSGSFIVTGGSGRYEHISGHAGLYGVIDRRTDSVIVQTTGKLSY